MSMANLCLVILFELLLSYIRLEEKLSDMEAMDQILRHQALINSPATKISEHFDIKRAQVNFLWKYQNLTFFFVWLFSGFVLTFFLFLYLQPVENGNHVSDQNIVLFLKYLVSRSQSQGRALSCRNR